MQERFINQDLKRKKESTEKKERREKRNGGVGGVRFFCLCFFWTKNDGMPPHILWVSTATYVRSLGLGN